MHTMARNRRLQIGGALLAAAVALTGTVAAQQTQAVDVNTLGPQVGERALPFSLIDQKGATQTLASVAGPKGTMLVFFRSADW